MPSFADQFKGDPNLVLELQPEELAFCMLRKIQQRHEDHNFMHPRNIVSKFASEFTCGSDASLQKSLPRAFAEALAVLSCWGLVAEGGEHILFVTRRGMRVQSESDFTEIRKSQLFPREVIHPKIVAGVWGNFLRGDYDVAVFSAFKAVEVAVRDATGLAQAYGVELMRKAFPKDKSTSYLTDPKADVAEQEALQHLFAGAFGYFRNPVAHRDMGISDPAEAIEMICLASHLLRIVEQRVLMISAPEQSSDGCQ